jgi:rhodanese-related sulfurtransferase
MGWYERLVSRNVPNISPEEAYRRLQENADVVIVDVRQPMETDSGSVPGAVLIPLTEFSRRLTELPRDRPILTICLSSHRSPIAARQLKKAGYDVTNVSGGTDAWRKAGLPFAKPNGKAGAG